MKIGFSSTSAVKSVFHVNLNISIKFVIIIIIVIIIIKKK